MDRIALPFGGPPPGTPAARVVEAYPAQPAGPVLTHMPKGTSAYLRALRRRFWLVALVAVSVILPGSMVVLRQKDVYRAGAQIRIDPPTFDHRLATIMPNGFIGQESPVRMERYVPDKIAELHSAGLAERVAADPALNFSPSVIAVALGELAGLQSRRLQDSNTFDIWLESKDPARAAALVNTLLDRLKESAKTESDRNLETAKQRADKRLGELKADLAGIEQRIQEIREGTEMFAPDDANLHHQEYLELRSALASRKARHDELIQQQRLSRFLIGSESGRTLPAAHPYQRRIDELNDMKARLQMQLKAYRSSIARYGSDPAVRQYSQRLQQINRDLEQLYRIPVPQPGTGLSETLLTYSSEEIRQLEREVQALLRKMQDSMPTYQNFQGLLRQRESKLQQIDGFQERVDNFDVLMATANIPVEVRMRAEEPAAPVGPNRKLHMILVIGLGIGLGVGLVCLLESMDHRVKAPEHLSAGLTLPLFGVIPHIRRIAAFHRGGHLWTAGLPNSTEADAYRNLRASLLGSQGRDGQPIVTLLITSAKPGEGKSTTALNLAATCARAGERTLLLDVDLRRSSLGEVFEVDHDLGLVDVLRGDLPWQRAVVRTEMPNLDILPAGDPTGIPIEILGTLEMRQLLEGLSGHYHRVILDGPAVLGLADCRMLGRAVDAALLVVRSGAHALDPPRRAKLMLEQSRVVIAGVVFNALDEDLENWSSNAPGLVADVATRSGGSRDGRPRNSQVAAIVANGS